MKGASAMAGLWVFHLVFSFSAHGWEMGWDRSSASENDLRQVLRHAFARAADEGAVIEATDAERSQLQAPAESAEADRLAKQYFPGLPDARVAVIGGPGDPAEVDRFVETIVLNAERVDIQGHNGVLRAHLEFNADRLLLPLQGRDGASYGQAYAVALERVSGFTATYRQGMLIASDVRGLLIQVKFPLISDDVRLRRFTFSIENQMAAIYASAANGWVELVARASLRFRRFEGVDWFLPFLELLPAFLRDIVFRPRPPELPPLP